MENKVALKFDLEEHLWGRAYNVCPTCSNYATSAPQCKKVDTCHWIATGDPEDNNWIPSEYEDIE